MGKLRARIHHKAQSEIGRRQLGGGSGTTERDYSTCEVDPLAHVVQKLVVSLAYGRLPMNDEMFTPSMCRPSSARICDGPISARPSACAAAHRAIVIDTNRVEH